MPNWAPSYDIIDKDKILTVGYFYTGLEEHFICPKLWDCTQLGSTYHMEDSFLGRVSSALDSASESLNYKRN